MEIVKYSDVLENRVDLEKYSRKAQEEIQRRVYSMSAGELYTDILMCKGLQACPYQNDCPLLLESEPSENYIKVGEKCILELSLAKEWAKQYSFEYRIAANSRTQTQLVSSLVQIDIEIMRCNAFLSKEGFEQEIVMQKAGNIEIQSKQLHNLLSLIENLHKRREKVVSKLSALTTEKTEAFDPVKYVEAIRKKMGV